MAKHGKMSFVQRILFCHLGGPWLENITKGACGFSVKLCAIERVLKLYFFFFPRD